MKKHELLYDGLAWELILQSATNAPLLDDAPQVLLPLDLLFPLHTGWSGLQHFTERLVDCDEVQ